MYNLQEDFIVNNKKEFTDHCIVYFLIRNNKIVYVGQSEKGISRIYAHTDKYFDSYYFINCTKQDLDLLENHYIVKFKPEYNKKLNYNAVMTINVLRNNIKALGVPYPHYYKHNVVKEIENLGIPIYSGIGNFFISMEHFQTIMNHFNCKYILSKK